MAKKKAKKKVKKEVVIADPLTGEVIDNLGNVNLPDWAKPETITSLRDRIEKIEQRIDRIVAAITTSKPITKDM